VAFFAIGESSCAKAFIENARIKIAKYVNFFIKLISLNFRGGNPNVNEGAFLKLAGKQSKTVC
jgi:hypothetical protein